jgi:hypothetical protein
MLTKTPAAEAVLPAPADLAVAAPSVSWTGWRSRLKVLAMSLVVAWQSLAILVPPAPADSETVQALRYVLEPYLALFRLDNGWAFFAPIGKHAQFRYVIKDGEGIDHTFLPTEEPATSISKYVWWREWKYLFDGIMNAPQNRTASVGLLLCREHPELDPLFVTLLQIQEENYQPEDLLNGKRPLDPEFTSVIAMARVSCRNDTALPIRQSIRPRIGRRDLTPAPSAP